MAEARADILEAGLSYHAGLKVIMDHIAGHPGPLPILLNGAGPDVGMTTLTSDVLQQLRERGRFGFVYEGTEHLISRYQGLKSQIGPEDPSRFNQNLVVMKFTQQRGPFSETQGAIMYQNLIRRMLQEIASLGIQPDPDNLLSVNLQSTGTPFFSPPLPADILITNEGASQKPRF